MQLLVEQQAVIDYLKLRGTDAPPDTVIAEFRAAVDEFHLAFSLVPPALRLMEPAPGRWCAQEILDHVLECHRCAPEQLRLVLGGQQGDNPIRAFVQSSNPRAHAWRSMLREFREIHQALLGVAGEFSETSSLQVGAPVELVVRVQDAPRTRELEWSDYLDWKAYLMALRSHLRMHVKQLERTLEEVKP